VDHSNLAWLDNQMMIGPRDVDPAVLERGAVLGMARWEAAGAGEDFRQHAAAAGEMQDDQHRRG
jgi:hypothetical protein